MSISTKSAPAPLVLVVDDFEDNRELYLEYLAHHGYRTVGASSGGQAIALALEHAPDLVLMDLSLPVMDGWEATRRLKADPRTRATPVVALTGHVLSSHAQRASDVGCDAFLAKPCLPDQVLQTVRRLLPDERTPT
jgi:two-component system cell cycle response regulator DivK